jgi:hypothetical protein
MRDTQFRKITEEEFKVEQQKNPRCRARRGYVDLVILNSEYVSANTISIVSCKRYRDFLENLHKLRFPALDIAVEVVYYPSFDEKLHRGIMWRRIASTIQDYHKLVALMEFTDSLETPFCREACMMFFSNTRHSDELKEMLEAVPENSKAVFYSVFKKHL